MTRDAYLHFHMEVNPFQATVDELLLVQVAPWSAEEFQLAMSRILKDFLESAENS